MSPENELARAGSAAVRTEPANVDQAVRRINSLCKTATFDLAVAVGREIIDCFYGGDLCAWRDRGVKDVSFRKLARHPELAMSPSALYRSVAIYELCSRLGIQRYKHVSTSHIRLVLPLSEEEQGPLLAEAEVNRWPVRRLRDVIAARHGGEGGEVIESLPRIPAARSAPFREAMKSLEACIDETGNIVGAEDIGDPSPESARAIAALMQRLKYACESIERRVKPFVPGATTQPPPARSESLRRSR